MPIVSRLVAASGVAALFGVQGARVSRHRKTGTELRTKFLAGVPILNYHLAYEDHASLAEVDLEAQTQDWIVVVDASTGDEDVDKLCKLGDCKAEGHPGQGGVPFFKVEATEADLEQLLQQAGGRARYVEPDSTVFLTPEMDATPQANTWGLNRIGSEQRSSTGKGSHIYVLDTGIRVSHDDFGGRASPALDMARWINKECPSWSPLSCAADQQGHGTHCAGSAGGSSYGVAPGASIHAVKVLGDDGSGSWSWSYEALDFLVTKGERPAVASMSLGGFGRQLAMKDAVDAAVGGGVTVVVAAGNENDDACRYSPAFIPAAITVGSTTSTDERSSFSNFGGCVEIWAPGSDVLSAGHTSDSATATFSGTSMACPHVSGAAALILEKNPSMNSAKVLEKLHAVAENDAIAYLKPSDTNKFLKVNGL